MASAHCTRAPGATANLTRSPRLLVPAGRAPLGGLWPRRVFLRECLQGSRVQIRPRQAEQPAEQLLSDSCTSSAGADAPDSRTRCTPPPLHLPQIILSLTSKQLLAWITYGGTMRFKDGY